MVAVFAAVANREEEIRDYADKFYLWLMRTEITSQSARSCTVGEQHTLLASVKPFIHRRIEKLVISDVSAQVVEHLQTLRRFYRIDIIIVNAPILAAKKALSHGRDFACNGQKYFDSAG